MFEISLVPDVKSELIKKLKIRNLVFLICVIVAAACGGVFLILTGITGGQGIKLAAQDEEMACRSDGPSKDIKNCDAKKYGTPIMKFNNMSELLTIQDQMKNLSVLNTNKIKFSRVFDVLSVILPDDDNKVTISSLSTDIVNNTLFFDALGWSSNNIGYRALEAFKKNANRAYYDYGHYMRFDAETNESVEIPSYCIEEEVDANGVVFGIYLKGKPGCEAPMVEHEEESDENKTESEENDSELGGNENGEESEEGATAENVEENTSEELVALSPESKIERIRIRRTYNDEKDKENYKNGKDSYDTSDSNEHKSGYYFESACLKYDSDGKFDEASTLAACPLLTEEPNIGSSSYGRNSDEEMVLTFQTTLTLSHDIFLASNKHVAIVSPSKQNVTDSYIQLKDMFTAAAHDIESEEK